MLFGSIGTSTERELHDPIARASRWLVERARKFRRHQRPRPKARRA